MAGPLTIAVELLCFGGASFFFALAETAFFSLSQWQVRQLPERFGARGEAVTRLLANPQDLLATIVLGNMLANAGLVALGFWLVIAQGWSAGLTMTGVLVLILVGGEVVPKTLAVRAPERWAVRVARPMQGLQSVSRPLRRLATGLNALLLRRLVASGVQPTAAPTDAEYRELLELATQQGALRTTERDLILQIISLDRRTARDVMRPRAQMAALPDDLAVEEMVAAARRLRHRRLPIYDGSPDTIVSVLNTRQLLLDPQGDFAEAIEMPSFVPETMNLLRLLKSLQQQRRGLALVLDEFGATAGLVTIEDILGALVGRIPAEGERPAVRCERLPDGGWRVDAGMRLDEFRREYPALAEVPDVDTLGGLVLHAAGVVPACGESVTCGGLRLTVTKAGDRRISELIVTVAGRKGREPG
jgi:putative hemolysin